ncbi:MAG: DUF4153 domain-containing protein [Hyphomicrobiaceae bacterium]
MPDTIPQQPGSEGSMSRGGRLASLMMSVIPDVRRVLWRFPLPAAIATAFAIYLLLEGYKSALLPADLRLRLPPIATSGFLVTLAAALLGESRGRSQGWRLVAGLAGLALVACLIAFSNALDLSPAVLMLALLLLATLAAHLAPATERAAYWLFNHHLAIAAITALAGAALFAGGVSLILESLRYLFGVYIPHWWYEKLWITALVLIAPLTFLDLIPQSFDQRVTEGPQTEFTSQAVAILVRFILVPLLLVYAAILHAYAAKIAFDWALPKGRVGWIVSSYGAVATVTALLAFPTRQSGGALVSTFWRLWPWLLPVPAALLFIAVTIRIREYGLTEARYLLVLAGVWLLLLMATQGLRRPRDIRLIMGTLAALLLFATAGPWGMLGWSTRHQASELVARLTTAGLVKNGKIVIAPKATATVLPSDRRRIAGTLRYLAQRDRLALLQPLFAGVADDPFATRSNPSQQKERRLRRGAVLWYEHIDSDDKLASAISARLGLGTSLATTPYQRLRYLRTNTPTTIAVDKPSLLLGPAHIYVPRGQRATPPRSATIILPNGRLIASLEAGVLTVRHEPSGRSARFQLASSAALRERLEASGVVLKPADPRRQPLVLTRSDGDLDVILHLITASALDDVGPILELSQIGFWLQLPR